MRCGFSDIISPSVETVPALDTLFSISLFYAESANDPELLRVLTLDNAGVIMKGQGEIIQLYNLEFYRDRNGHTPVLEYLHQFELENSKDSRVNLRKIRSYMKVLTEKGTYVGEPYIKHLEGPIWELRPLRHRVLFAAWRGNGFILLHAFVKRTQRTPRREIERALREYQEIQEAENHE